MTTPTVIDGEVEEVIDTIDPPLPVDDESEAESGPDKRPFRVVSHKPAVWFAMGQFGGEVDNGTSVDPEKADQTLWWAPQDFAIQVLNANVDLPQLTAPHPGFVASLNESILGRKCGTIRKKDVPAYFVKNPDALDYGQVIISTPGEYSDLLPPQVASTEELADGTFPPGFDRLPDGSMVQLDQIAPCVAEARAWVADGDLVAFSMYRLGLIGWDSTLFMEVFVHEDSQKLIHSMVDEARVVISGIDNAPAGYALDLGLTDSGRVIVLRAWPAWAAEPMMADPVGVYTALVASHDFDLISEKWRWNPDRAVYDRSHLITPADEATEPPSPEDVFPLEEEGSVSE